MGDERETLRLNEVARQEHEERERHRKELHRKRGGAPKPHGAKHGMKSGKYDRRRGKNL